MLGAEALQPVRAPASGGDDHLVGGEFTGLPAVGDDHAPAEAARQEQVGALVAEEQFHVLPQEVLLDGVVDVLGPLGAQVADGAVHQLQARLDGPAADLLYLLVVAKALHVGVGAVAEVDLVGIADGLLHLVRPHQVGQVASHLAAEGKFAVGEGAGAGEAGGDVAVGLAVHTLPGLVLGAAAVLDGGALLHDEDALPAAKAPQLQGGEDARRARADDDDVGVCVHF